MHASMPIPNDLGRAERYAALLPAMRALLAGEGDAIAAMANLSAGVHAAFGWHWVGFYRVIGKELVLGPFQGPVACTPIPYGAGVCGTAWSTGAPVIVPDVEAFPGHIVCSAASRSEIVIPLRGRSGQVAAVLDVDSDKPDDFGLLDQSGLTSLCALIEPLLP